MLTKDVFIGFIHDLQGRICAALEGVDGKARFEEDAWTREGGGGGLSKVIVDGDVFAKGGVNTSVVHGKLPEMMQQALKVSHADFLAAGISLVIHPLNPYVPTVHANFRYFELYDAEGRVCDAWFGGGADLTPYYLFLEDGRHFHQIFKGACDPFGLELYPDFKKECDGYFVNKHRNNESRGIGGIFFDYRRQEQGGVDWLAFSMANGNAFLESYLPIVKKRKGMVYGERELNWQGYRRGRYVEFNLIHDRGTLFGLKTNGRIESIFMSLPPVAKWVYNYQPAVGSPEAFLEKHLKPFDWV